MSEKAEPSMIDTVPDTDERAETPKSDVSPGEMLHRARESLNLTIADLAGMTRLSRNVLEALEKNDFASLAMPVYVRGYFRKCAHVLNMPEERLLQAYADWTGTSLKPQPLPVTVNEPPEEYESPSGAPSWTYLLVIAIVIGAVLWWFGSGDGTTQAPEAKVGDGITPLQIEESPLIMQPLPLGPTADNTVAPAQPGDVAGSTSGTQLMTEGAAAPGAEASRAGASSTPAGETQPATPPGPATLRLSFTQTSWVEIYDDDNKRLAYGLLSPGTEQQVNGKPPYEVLLGRPQGVQLSMGGRVIDLAPYIAPNGTARFKLKAP